MPHRHHQDRLAPRIHSDLARRSLSRFGPLSDEEGRTVSAALDRLEIYRPGQGLIAEGGRAGPPRLLLEGWVLQQRTLADGERQIFGFLLPGDVLGLSAHPANLALYTAVAATQLVLSPMPFLDEALYGEEGALRRFAWHMVAYEEASLRDQVVRLGRQSAHQRLIHLLLEFHARLMAVGLAGERGFHLPLSQEILSDALGLSVVHTNRILQQLKREQLIESRGGNIVLCDLQRMMELVDYRPSPHWPEPDQADAQASLKVPSCSSTQTAVSSPSA